MIIILSILCTVLLCALIAVKRDFDRVNRAYISANMEKYGLVKENQNLREALIKEIVIRAAIERL